MEKPLFIQSEFPVNWVSGGFSKITRLADNTKATPSKVVIIVIKPSQL